MSAAPGPDSLFAFVQFEFGFLLGPADGRYLLRDEPQAAPRSVVVLRTLGAPQRRLLAGRRAKRVAEAEAEPVPTSRATLIRPDPFAGEDEAARWLDGLRADDDALSSECESGLRVLNAVLRAHRAAAADPFARDASAEHALVARVGYGDGEQVAAGRFAAGVAAPRGRPKASRSERIAPQERLAALLAGRATQLACEELVLRARADLAAERPREAALEARIALEAAAAELRGTRAGTGLDELLELRATVGEAANAALRADPAPALAQAVSDAVALMERALRRYRAEASQQGLTES